VGDGRQPVTHRRVRYAAHAPLVLEATMTGDLYLYRGNGTGGFSGARTKIGTGWQVFR
jgi:hypothetical protein